MNKRARICFYIFLFCTFCALGIIGYFILGPKQDEVMVAPRFFTFIGVEDADSYKLKASKTDGGATDYTVKCKVNKEKLEDDDEYSFHNVVTNESGDKKLVEETYTQKITKYDSLRKKINCVISNYEVTIYAEDDSNNVSYKCPEKELEGIDANSVCCLIGEYFGNLFNEDGTYYIYFVAVDKDGNEIENTNEKFKFDYTACYENEFSKREKFFMNGVWNDYIITSEEDLELFVWHSILYRRNDVTFFVKTDDITSSNINRLVVDFINSYPEYDGLYGNSENTFAKMKNSVGTLVNFKFFLDKDHDKIVDKELEIRYSDLRETAIEQLKHKNENFNVDYVKYPVDEENRELKIDECSNSVLVYNTEQLFMVVQYGAKPVFENDCIAKQVYDNAIEISLAINNSNNLTDYEKALNIYRYICKNVVYDYVSLSYMEQLKDYSVAKFGNLSCFYLEGALYKPEEGQYAVCDGLSKTYCLLARIEGLECYKVNGEVTGGNHAWNMIKIVDEDLNLNGWYGIDTTWGMATSEDEEILTHAYFLRLGSDYRKSTFCPNGNRPIEADYYKKATYEFNDITNDFYIKNNRELKDVFDYAKSELDNSGKDAFVIEFKLDFLYSRTVPLFNKKRVNSLETNNYDNYFGWLENRGINLETNEYVYDVYFMKDIIVVSVSHVEVVNE